MTDLKNLIEQMNSSKTTKSDVWNYSNLFDSNIFDCQNITSDKTTFLELKKSDSEFKKLRNKLRKFINELQSDFLKETDKNKQLAILQKIKLFVSNFGGKSQITSKVSSELAKLK